MVTVCVALTSSQPYIQHKMYGVASWSPLTYWSAGLKVGVNITSIDSIVTTLTAVSLMVSG